MARSNIPIMAYRCTSSPLIPPTSQLVTASRISVWPSRRPPQTQVQLPALTARRLRVTRHPIRIITEQYGTPQEILKVRHRRNHIRSSLAWPVRAGLDHGLERLNGAGRCSGRTSQLCRRALAAVFCWLGLRYLLGYALGTG